MGVYIKNMEMPSSCWDCEVGGAKQMDNATCPFYSMEFWEQENYQDKIADGCPLVPVPPHGRLIEAEPIMKYITDGLNSADLGYDAIKVMTEIEYAPTIIPAEEGEHTMEEFMYGQEGNLNDGSM